MGDDMNEADDEPLGERRDGVFAVPAIPLKVSEYKLPSKFTMMFRLEMLQARKALWQVTHPIRPVQLANVGSMSRDAENMRDPVWAFKSHWTIMEKELHLLEGIGQDRQSDDPVDHLSFPKTWWIVILSCAVPMTKTQSSTLEPWLICVSIVATNHVLLTLSLPKPLKATGQTSHGKIQKICRRLTRFRKLSFVKCQQSMWMRLSNANWEQTPDQSRKDRQMRRNSFWKPVTCKSAVPTSRHHAVCPARFWTLASRSTSASHSSNVRSMSRMCLWLFKSQITKETCWQEFQKSIWICHLPSSSKKALKCCLACV